MILTLDVGGTFIKYALSDGEGNFSDSGKVPAPRKSQDEFLSAIEEVLLSFNGPIEGIAMSLPGTIDTDSGYVFQGGSLTYNSRTNLKEIMEDRFRLPVELENDARCAALAEMWKGNLQGIKNGLVLTFGTGIGGGLVIDGKIYKGSHLFAGEVSALVTKDMQTHGRGALWGAQGSVPGLIKRICDAKGTGLKEGEEVFQWIEKGDETAGKIFKDYCTDIAVQLFNFQIIIDPERVCIGGGVSANPLFIQGIIQSMDEFYEKFSMKLPKLEIVPCKFHNHSNLLGALYHFKTKHGF